MGRKGRFPDRGAAIEIFMTAFDPLLGRFARFLSRPVRLDSTLFISRLPHHRHSHILIFLYIYNGHLHHRIPILLSPSPPPPSVHLSSSLSVLYLLAAYLAHIRDTALRHADLLRATELPFASQLTLAGTVKLPLCARLLPTRLLHQQRHTQSRLRLR